MPSSSTTSSPSACAGQKPYTPRAVKRAVADDLVEQLLRVVVQLARLGPLEDRRELALQLPRVEEELPVDVLAQRREVGLDDAARR